MQFTRTSQDADTHNLDACCGEFYSASRLDTDDLPDDEKAGGIVYCYARCGNCGALWRDGFRDGHHTEFEYTGRGDRVFDSESFEWEFDHIDTNKLHDGRAVVVYTPANNPIDDWLDKDYIDEAEAAELRETESPDMYEKHATYVYRFSEVDPSTIAPVVVDGRYDYRPDPDIDTKYGIAITVTDIEFTDAHDIAAITATVTETADYAGETDLDRKDTLTFETPEEFATTCTLVEDPYSGVISRRPSL